ncbi:glutamine-dependent NAD(+) synthetase-like isoform X1 [Carex rostrata]
MRLLKVATCNLNQWAMDFDTNLKNIKESIRQAKEAGAKIRIGPELEITGYGCEDHFLEEDTVNHAWECLAEILTGDWTEGILCSIGMPLTFENVRYNCQVFCMNRQILMIRPKMTLAHDGNYRELRWFSAWKKKEELLDFDLPVDVAEAISQSSVPFGYGYLKFLDVLVAAETCEELFTASPPRAELSYNGVEVFVNASGSHHQLRKLNVRIDAIKAATVTCGGVYMYANQQGCDGGRLYYDGCCCVTVNGDVVAQGSQFSLKDVEVLTAVVDLDAISSYRGSSSSFREQASRNTNTVPYIKVPEKLCQKFRLGTCPTAPVEVKYHLPQEEIAFGPSCWLWDYLRRSGASGFLLPLSGGADSSSVAAIVGCMCQLVVKDIEKGDEQVKADALRIGQYKNGEFPNNSQEFASRIFYTVFMGSENSSEATRSRAKVLANEVGSHHVDVAIDTIVLAFLSVLKTLSGKLPRYKVDGGSNTENLGLQNIQARVRMVLAYMLSLFLPWMYNKSGFYLVLGCSNVDEALRGYLTKYDCSAADLNPIGSVSKQDLRSFLRWAAVHLHFPSLAGVEAAPPTAELEPIRSDYSQLDEVDMGMTYEELSVYGRLRKIFRCGPVAMYQYLCAKWKGKFSPSEVAEKVKHFFRYYAINRHKMTVLTPSYHAESYSPEDNRFDLRQFLYNSRWPYQFCKIDELAKEAETDDGQVENIPDEDLVRGPDGNLAQGSGMGVVVVGSGNPSAGL